MSFNNLMKTKSVSYKSARSLKYAKSLTLEHEVKATALQVKLKYHTAESALANMKIKRELYITKACLQVIKE